MKEKVICYIMILDFFAASNSYDFLKSVLFKFAEKSDCERVNLSYFTLLWVGLARSRRKERLVVAQD